MLDHSYNGVYNQTHNASGCKCEKKTFIVVMSNESVKNKYQPTACDFFIFLFQVLITTHIDTECSKLRIA